MKLKEFNQKIENLRNYFDACLFELRTKEMDTETVLLVKNEKRGYELLELHFSNNIVINSRLGFDQLGLMLNYEWASYDENDLGEDEKNDVQTIINTFKGED